MALSNDDLWWIYEGFCECDTGYQEWFIGVLLGKHPDLYGSVKKKLMEVWYRGKDNELTDEQCEYDVVSFISDCCE